MERENDRSYSTISSDDGGGRRTVTTKTTTKVTPYDPSSGILPPPGTQEEWTTTKRKVNHKTKQVETRVQRQIIMEDGKVIADSGPQVTTKTTEDQKSDESEDVKHLKLGDSEVPEEYRNGIGNQIVSEKKVTHNVQKQAKEDNYKYHDESLRELEGDDIHKRAVKAPHELIRIDNELPEVPRGKLVHYSAKGKKTNDRDEVNETSRLGKDGLLNTESTQTHHHEEYEDEEVPEESEDGKRLVESSHFAPKQLEYYNDRDHSVRSNSSLSVQQRSNKSSHKKWRDGNDPSRVNTDNDSDGIVETSEVYKLSDRMRSLNTNSAPGKKSRSKHGSRKDDASTQASLSDSDDDHHHQGKASSHHGLQEVHEHFESKKSTFHTPDKCCDPLSGVNCEGVKNKYYFGTGGAPPSGDREKGYISSSVKTSKFATDDGRVVEDKSFNEDFERTFKNDDERRQVAREYDRFVEHAKDHTKSIRERTSSPGLPPPMPGEIIHRPVMVEHSSSLLDAPARTKSFYEHQVHEYESKNHNRGYTDGTGGPSSYSTLPPPVSSSYRASSPVRNGSWSKNSHYEDHQHYSSGYQQPRTGSSVSFHSRHQQPSRSASRTEFPDFAPLSSPLEIQKSLHENRTTSSRHHISTYN